MSKNLDKSSGVIKNHSSASWLLLFSGLALFIFFFRGFLFNEYGGVANPLVGAIIPFLVLMLTLFTISISPVFFRMISLEKNGEDKGVAVFFKESIARYKDIDAFIFFLILFAVTITIWFKTYNYRGQASDLFFIEDIYHYSIYIGIMVLVAFILFKASEIFKTVKPANNIKEDEGHILKNIIKYSYRLGSFRSLITFMLFSVFIIAFLSDLFKRSGHGAMGGLFIVIFTLAISVSSTLLIFIGMLITTKGIKKSLFSKILFLSLTAIVAISLFAIFYRFLWIDLYF